MREQSDWLLPFSAYTFIKDISQYQFVIVPRIVVYSFAYEIDKSSFGEEK